ncbi:MAG: quinoprotein dehydrogenase-associated putative ABC transporter substrate-binding protein [Vicinamibacterales bacterium]
MTTRLSRVTAPPRAVCLALIVFAPLGWSAPSTIIRAETADPGVLRVCADPNNLPFSNRARQGFEDAIARLLADYRGERLEYTWWPQRRGFLRTTLNAGVCDVVMGVPSTLHTVLVTAPYYTSSYAFVSRRDAQLAIDSIDDERLRSLTIGVHVMGNDYALAPPGEALIARGLAGRIKGYSILGNYQQPNPPADLIDAVANKQVDVALAWGPLAGYFAARSKVPLDVRVARPVPAVPLQFSMSMGVRSGDVALQRELNAFLVARKTAVKKILDSFHVPTVAAP